MKKYILTIAILISANTAFGQIKEDLPYFVSTHFKTPPELKDVCDWIYLFVKLKLDNQNKVLSYECLNKYQNQYVPNVHLENSFDFLKGYQLKNIPTHPKYVLIYFSITNYQDCTVRPSDVVSHPNGGIMTFLEYVKAAKKEDPNIYIYEDPIIINPFSKQY